MAEAPQHRDIGKRLEALRLSYAADMAQSAWAEAHGFNKSQYNNWEVGSRRIPVDSAEVLADRYGLSLDWIYRGKMDGLSDTALKKLLSHLPR